MGAIIIIIIIVLNGTSDSLEEKSQEVVKTRFKIFMSCTLHIREQKHMTWAVYIVHYEQQFVLFSRTSAFHSFKETKLFIGLS